MSALDNLVHCLLCGSLCSCHDCDAVVCWDCEDRYFLSHAIVIEEEA